MAVRPARRLFTVDEYHRMVEAGILHEDDRVELLDGEIVEMSPIGPLHAGSVNALIRLFIEALGRRAVVTPQNPAVLDDLSEPQPDVCLARPKEDDYRTAHPRPDDLLLVVEVADTSIDYDRGRKTPRYALAGIRETWVVDLSADRVDVFREPSPGGYRDQTSVGRGDRVAPLAFPDVSFDVDEILGPRP
jgi:Uma2 family endonuclease